MRADPARQGEHREAYEGWRKQLQAMQRVLLDGDPSSPPQLKSLLNREERAQERYDTARLAPLGLNGGEDDPFSSVG